MALPQRYPMTIPFVEGVEALLPSPKFPYVGPLGRTKKTSRGPGLGIKHCQRDDTPAPSSRSTWL